jgi:hypothetical protein
MCIFRVIKSRRMRRVGTGELRNAFKMLLRKLEGTRPGQRWKESIQKEYKRIVMWISLNWLRQGSKDTLF